EAEVGSGRGDAGGYGSEVPARPLRRDFVQCAPGSRVPGRHGRRRAGPPALTPPLPGRYFFGSLPSPSARPVPRHRLPGSSIGRAPHFGCGGWRFEPSPGSLCRDEVSGRFRSSRPSLLHAVRLMLVRNDLPITLFDGRSNPALARAIAEHAEWPLGHVTLKNFADGEIYVRYEESIR